MNGNPAATQRKGKKVLSQHKVRTSQADRTLDSMFPVTNPSQLRDESGLSSTLKSPDIPESRVLLRSVETLRKDLDKGKHQGQPCAEDTALQFAHFCCDRAHGYHTAPYVRRHRRLAALFVACPACEEALPSQPWRFNVILLSRSLETLVHANLPVIAKNSSISWDYASSVTITVSNWSRRRHCAD